MQRLHIHIGVDDLDQGIRFYSTLFDARPVKVRKDYAKWMLDDPRVNFAISTRRDRPGLDHLGVQVDDDGELAAIRERLGKAELAVFDEGETVCCYARSDKTWVRDPAGVAWEAYRTMADAEVYDSDAATAERACCTPVQGGECRDG